MKIGGPGSVRSSPKRPAGRKKQSGSGDFVRHVAGDATVASAGVPGNTQLTSVEALLAIQETPDPTRRGAPGVTEAKDLLDRLDEIRLGILAGRLSRPRLEELVRQLDRRREARVDPRLAELLNEIELRAKVELAKLSVI
ncbi:MAG: flagellar assembly protein FliX [Alphaproteobacteria bacterium]